MLLVQSLLLIDMLIRYFHILGFADFHYNYRFGFPVNRIVDAFRQHIELSYLVIHTMVYLTIGSIDVNYLYIGWPNLVERAHHGYVSDYIPVNLDFTLVDHKFSYSFYCNIQDIVVTVYTIMLVSGAVF